MAAGKVDPYRDARAEYAATRVPALVEVKAASYVTIAGEGPPGEPAFGKAIGALYAVAFTTKMASKFAGRDYAVSKLEGLWWGPREYPVAKDASRPPWRWKLLLRTPGFVKPGQVNAAIRSLLAKGKPADVKRVRLERLEEGRCVQVLHVGPYDAEAATIESLKAFADSRGLKLRGRHHEIYLSDPRRTALPKLKTILRHPVR